MMQIDYFLRLDVQGFANWHTGEPFPITDDSLGVVERVHLDGDELTYASHLVARQGEMLPPGRVLVIEGGSARAVVRLMMDDLAANPPMPRPVPIPQHETQATISQWADATFGTGGSNARAAARANEEMAELLRDLTTDDSNPRAAAEIADIFIVLYRVAWRLGVDVHEEIDRKMQINKSRTWKRDGTGHGYHVKGLMTGYDR